MSGVRVLVGTKKGAFILTSDAKRKKWDISGLAGRSQPDLLLAVDWLAWPDHPALG
jgi:hypothetical protein